MDESSYLDLGKRRSGILLHPTSLPGPYYQGILDENSYRFIDFISASGFSLWQLLPLVQTFSDRSPYNSPSSFAGNIELISVKNCYQKLLSIPDQAEPNNLHDKLELLNHCYIQFQQGGDSIAAKQYDEFKRTNNHWLDDYTIFAAIQDNQNHAHWKDWPKELKLKQSDALNKFIRANTDSIERIKFQQFVFYSQWTDLKRYANERNVYIFGDIPIFVSDNSADVWANKELFKLNAEGDLEVVAGVPPDYFSKTGQRWGNPLYRWENHQATDFDWWRKRIHHSLKLYDTIRIDHFRGFSATWEIPPHEETAINGQWVNNPGKELFQKLEESFGKLPIIAEDLGIIDEDVEDLRDSNNLPGMKILHFAFDSDSYNPYLPHNHPLDSVVYTGTHDNDTTLGWWNQLNQQTKDKVQSYYSWPSEKFPWPIIKSALASVANTAIVPMQDALCLGSEARMNIPGTTTDNWQWRFNWGEIHSDLSGYLLELNNLYSRL